MNPLGRGRSAAFIAVVVASGFVWYFVTGGPGSPDDDNRSVKKPWDAVEMTVSSVRDDGTFRGRVEQSGRHAEKGLRAIGTYDRVTLRLADIEPPSRRDACWIEEGRTALKGLIGARIWIDPGYVIEQGSGTFTVFAWNRSGTFVQEKLLRDGNGKVYAGQTSAMYADELTAAEDEAAAAERGLWGACGEQ